MTPLRKHILIGMTVLGLSAATLPVQAHQDRPGQAAGAEARHAQRAARTARHQQQLHDALKLTAAQEDAWNTYLQARRPGAHGQRPARADWIALPAPARMEQRIALAKQRTALLEARLAALNGLYAVLSPEQKKVFDEQDMRRGGRHRHHQHRPMGA